MSRERKFDNTAILNIVSYLLSTLIISSIISVIIYNVLTDMNQILVYSNFFTYLVLFILIITASRKYLIEQLHKSSFKETLKKALILVAFAYLMNIVISQLAYNIFDIQGTSANQESLNGAILSNGFIPTLIFTVFFGPLCEEMVFRFSIIRLLEKKFSKYTCIIISSLLFGSIHVISGFSIAYLIIYSMLGFVFGYMYYKNDKLIISNILGHMIYNFITVVAIYLIA